MYSLGILLFEILFGEMPYMDGVNTMEDLLNASLKHKMKFVLLLIAAVSAINIKQQEPKVVNGKYWFCDPPLPNTVDQLNIELDFFSRKLDKTH